MKGALAPAELKASTMKIWILEDIDSTVEILKARILECQRDAVIEILQTVEAADRALEKISDADVVFVDSQVPTEVDGERISDAGVRFVAKVRARGCACRILWHSISPSTSLSGLGVERVMARNIDSSLLTSDVGPRQAIRKEKWRRSGQDLLAQLTANRAPLSEFVAMSILCQGYLAIVGAAGRFRNEVADELAKSEVGRECLAAARGHLDEALNATEWFAAGRKKIAAAMRDGEETFWRGVSEGREELGLDVTAIRNLYERVGGAKVNDAATADDLHQLVADAHRGLQGLARRGGATSSPNPAAAS